MRMAITIPLECDHPRQKPRIVRPDLLTKGGALERKLQAKLDIPWCACCCCEDAECRTSYDGPWMPEIGMIESVEKLRTEFEFEALGKLEVLKQRQIRGAQSGPSRMFRPESPKRGCPDARAAAKASS